MKTTVDRFQRPRWSETRKQIDAMNVGSFLTFGGDQYFNAKTSVDRLSDAYPSRQWKIQTVNVQGSDPNKRRISIVTRIK